MTALLVAALSDVLRTPATSTEDLREAVSEYEEDKEIEEGAEEDETFRRQLARKLESLRESRSVSEEARSGAAMDSSDAITATKEGGRPLSEKASASVPFQRELKGIQGEPSVLSAPPSPDPDSSPALHTASRSGFWRKMGRLMFGAKERGGGGPQEGDPDYVYPKYRWTPIFSGIAQPFSILLEIPSLTEHWYVRQVDGVPIVYQENPVLLDVGLAISMACGVIANIALISRFLERRVFASTIICIVMLSIHDIINIIALTIFGVIHGVDDGFDYSEAFWMCVCSTTASFFTNLTLLSDIIRTKQFRHSGSGLTPKQRKLVIVVMVLLVYIALGALAFHFLIPGLPFKDALYFTVVTLETIGFGDISPTSGARIFLFFYVPLGILILAVAVGTARDTLVESWSGAYRRRRHKVLQRQRERRQQREEEGARLAAAENRREGGYSLSPHRHSNPPGGASQTRHDAHHIELETLSTGSPEANAHLTNKSAADDLHYREALAQLSMENEEGYKSFQERMRHEERMENLWKFGSAAGLFIVFWLVGAGIFTRTEDPWSFFTALYFCFVTFTTIGYGDVVPLSPAGRAVFIIWAICGVGIVTLLFAVIAEAYSHRYHMMLSSHDEKEHAQSCDILAGVDQINHFDEEERARSPQEVSWSSG